MALHETNEFSHDGTSVEIAYEGPIGGELTANGAVTPGAVVEYHTNAGEGQEGTADSAQIVGFATGNALASDPADGVESDLLTDYADGERFSYRNRHGDKWWGILADQSGTDVEPGTKLKCNGSGELTPVASADDPSVVVAELLGRDARAPNGSSERAPMRWIA